MFFLELNQGRRKLFYGGGGGEGGGGLSKNVEAVPQKTKFGPKYK